MIDVDASLQEYVVLRVLFSTNYGSSKAHQADWTPSPTSNRCQPFLSLTAYGAIVSITHYTFLLCVHFVSDQFCLCPRSVYGQYKYKPNTDMSFWVLVVLFLRVWVLYNREKWMGIGLFSLFFSALGSALAIKIAAIPVRYPLVIYTLLT